MTDTVKEEQKKRQDLRKLIRQMNDSLLDDEVEFLCEYIREDIYTLSPSVASTILKLHCILKEEAEKLDLTATIKLLTMGEKR